MEISIITVVFNDRVGIKKTIDSVRSQTNHIFEFIVIDGGSTDGTVDIIRENLDLIDYWVSEHDSGIYNAMNKGIKAAHCDWLIFLNAGDSFYGKTALAKMAPYIQDRSYSVVYGKIMQCYERRNEVGENIIKKEAPDIVDFVIRTIPHQAAFIQKKLFEKYGFYDETYRLAADQIFFMQTIGVYHEKCRFVDIVVAYFMMGGRNEKNRKQCEIEKRNAIEKEMGNCYNYLRELAEYRNSSILSFLLAIRRWARRKGVLSIIRSIVYYRR